MAKVVSTLSRLFGERSSDPFEVNPDLRAARDSVREYVAASRAARARAALRWSEAVS